MTIEPLLRSGLDVQVHVAAALLAFALGCAQPLSRKGSLGHRIVGYIWVALMVVVAVSSFFIHEIRLLGLWSPIHLLSLLTLFGLWGALRSLRMGRYRRHGLIMMMLFVFALLGAGVFTLLPGRLMHVAVFG